LGLGKFTINESQVVSARNILNQLFGILSKYSNVR
jgi:hypothetical protein